MMRVTPAAAAMIKRYSYPVVIFLVSRVGLFLLVYVSLITISIRPGEEYWSAFPDNLFLNGLCRWDSSWYADIIRFGYQNQNKGIGIGQDTAFFPLYPLISAFVKRVVGEAYLAGLIVSNLAFFVALLVLYKLLTEKYGEEVAWKTLLLMIVNPFSLFFSSVYTESLFLLCVVLSFYFAEKGNFLAAALSAALAGATRFVGVVLIVPLLMIYIQQKNYSIKAVRPDLLTLLLIFAGPGLYMVFLAVQYGAPLQFLISQDVWGSLNPLAMLAHMWRSITVSALLNGSYDVMNIINLAAALPLLAGLFYASRIGYPYITFSVLVFAISLSRVQGLGRYMMVVFPVSVALAMLMRHRTVFYSYVYFSILFLALFSIMFSHWYWVA